MKTSLLFFVLPLVIAFTSCEKEDDEEVEVKVFANADIATNTGTRRFSTQSVNATYDKNALVKLTVTFDGSSGGEYLVLGVKNFDTSSAPGVYTIGTAPSTTAIAAYRRPNGNSDEIATSGQVVVRFFRRGIVSGTFNFSTPNTQVTNGDFEVRVK